MRACALGRLAHVALKLGMRAQEEGATGIAAVRVKSSKPQDVRPELELTVCRPHVCGKGVCENVNIIFVQMHVEYSHNSTCAALCCPNAQNAWRSSHPSRSPCSWRVNRLLVHVRLFPDAVLCHHLHQHALEVDRQTSLELIRAHPENLHALLEVDVGVVVLVEK